MSALYDAVVAKAASRISGNDEAKLVGDTMETIRQEDDLRIRKARKAYVKEVLKDLREAKAQVPVDDDEVAWLQAEIDSLKAS